MLLLSVDFALEDKSPSLGREWIEMDLTMISVSMEQVSLLGEGVD